MPRPASLETHALGDALADAGVTLAEQLPARKMTASAIAALNVLVSAAVTLKSHPNQKLVQATRRRRQAAR